MIVFHRLNYRIFEDAYLTHSNSTCSWYAETPGNDSDVDASWNIKSFTINEESTDENQLNLVRNLVIF